jgi:hypothetical protein
MSKINVRSNCWTALTLSGVAAAATNTYTESERVLRLKQMDDCFAARANLMNKPAVKNRVNCCKAHRH